TVGAFLNCSTATARVAVAPLINAKIRKAGAIIFERCNTKVRKGLNQFRDWLTAVGDQVLRTAREVGEGYLANVNAKVPIKRGEHFAKLHGTLRRFATQAISSAD